MYRNVGIHCTVRPHLKTSIITVVFLSACLAMASTCGAQTREEVRPQGTTYVNQTGEVVDQYEQAALTNPPTPSRFVRSLQPDESWTDGPTRVSPLEWKFKSGEKVELKEVTLSSGQKAMALVKGESTTILPTTRPMTTLPTTTPPTTTLPTTTTPTTLSNVLDVPVYAQQTSMWCWATGGEMIMKYHGVDVAQCRQANEYYPKNLKDFTTWGIDCCGFLGAGTTVDPRIVVGGWPQYQDYGFTYKKKNDSPMSFAEIKAQIDAKQPIGFAWWWKNPPTDIPGGGHYMVLTGYRTIAGIPMVKIHDPGPWSVVKESNPADHTKWIAYSYWCESAKHKHGEDHYDIKKN